MFSTVTKYRKVVSIIATVIIIHQHTGIIALLNMANRRWLAHSLSSLLAKPNAWQDPFTAASHSDVTLATHLDNAVGKLEAKFDTDGLQVALAPLLDAVLHHVGNHCDEHIHGVQLVPAPLQHPSPLSYCYLV